MKTRVTRDRKSGAITLSIRPQRSEALDYVQAEWLRGAHEEMLLEFSYTLEGSGAELFFDLTDTEELPRYLKRTKITSAQFQGMVCAVRDALSLATSRGMATSFLRFDPGMVRATPEGRLRFALVPMAGVPAVAENSPSFILRFLGEHARFVVGDDSRHAEALLDFVRRNQVLSLSAFNAFLKAQFGTASLGASAASAAGEGDAPAQAVPTPTASGRSAGSGGPPSSSVGSTRAAFDPISMLLDAPSAAEITASQGVSDRVRTGIGEISPTAAPRRTENAPAPPSGSTTLLGAPGSSRSAPDLPRRRFISRVRDGARYQLPDLPVCVIGRSKSCDVVVDGNGNISRRHASLMLQGGRIFIADEGSANGTFVGGSRLPKGAQMPLEPGDRFLLADEGFAYLED